MIRRFLRDRRGTSFEGIALCVSIIAVAFVASADMLDSLTKTHRGSDIVATMTAKPVSPSNANLDYAPTASLPKLISHSVLDPCTGVVR